MSMISSRIDELRNAPRPRAGSGGGMVSEPEVKFEIDEHGRIGYRVTNEGVLLSKDEKEFIIDHITRMQEENAKLRELLDYMTPIAWYAASERERERIRELGVEV